MCVFQPRKAVISRHFHVILVKDIMYPYVHGKRHAYTDRLCYTTTLSVKTKTGVILVGENN